MEDETNRNFAQYLTSFECLVELIINESNQPPRHLKYFFGQITDLEKIVLMYHFHLGKEPKYFDQYYVLLFRSLRESPNQVYSPHTGHFKGMLPHFEDRNFAK